jgi:hypothetical protein
MQVVEGNRVAGILFAAHPSWMGRAEESINVRQSAKQLDVQKNVLPNGFDGSTENRAFLSPSFQKFEVAPFLVKNRSRAPYQ